MVEATITVVDGTVIVKTYNTMDEATGYITSYGVLEAHDDGTFTYHLPRHVTHVSLRIIADTPPA